MSCSPFSSLAPHTEARNNNRELAPRFVHFPKILNNRRPVHNSLMCNTIFTHFPRSLLQFSSPISCATSCPPFLSRLLRETSRSCFGTISNHLQHTNTSQFVTRLMTLQSKPTRVGDHNRQNFCTNPVSFSTILNFKQFLFRFFVRNFI